MNLSMTIQDATPDELARVLESLREIGAVPQEKNLQRAESTDMWTNEEVDAAWEQLSPGCRDIFREACKWPTEAPSDELKAAVGKDQSGFGGTLSSVGAMMRKGEFRELGWPIRHIKNAQGLMVYRIRQEWRRFIADLG